MEGKNPFIHLFISDDYYVPRSVLISVDIPAVVEFLLFGESWSSKQINEDMNLQHANVNMSVSLDKAISGG
jgi:hypothetical protein